MGPTRHLLIGLASPQQNSPPLRAVGGTWVRLEGRGHEAEGELQCADAQHINIHLLLRWRQQAPPTQQRLRMGRQGRATAEAGAVECPGMYKQ